MARDIVGSIADGSASPAESSRQDCPRSAESAPACGLVFVISGPSGVGKDTVKRCLKAQGFPLGYCVTATTRSPRTGETDGIDYHFVTGEEFEAMLDAHELVEHAENHGNLYGVPYAELKAGLRRGPDVLVTPDVQGAAALRDIYPGVISIFLAPPSLKDLKERIIKRGSVTPEDLARRLETAASEIEQDGDFDYRVINKQDQVDETVETVKAIITAERCRVTRRTVTIE